MELARAKIAKQNAAREARFVARAAAHLAQRDELRRGVEGQTEPLQVIQHGVLAAARALRHAGNVPILHLSGEQIVRGASFGVAQRLERGANRREPRVGSALVGMMRPSLFPERALDRPRVRVARHAEHVVVLRAREVIHVRPRVVPRTPRARVFATSLRRLLRRPLRRRRLRLRLVRPFVVARFGGGGASPGGGDARSGAGVGASGDMADRRGPRRAVSRATRSDPRISRDATGVSVPRQPLASSLSREKQKKKTEKLASPVSSGEKRATARA